MNVNKTFDGYFIITQERIALNSVFVQKENNMGGLP